MSLFCPTSVSFLAIAIAIASIAGCGPGPRPVAAPTHSVETAPTAIGPSDARNGYAKVMQATTIDGVRVGEAQQATALVVFASWCGPCRHELGVLGQLRKQYPQLRIIGLNAYEDYDRLSDQSQLREYVANNAPWLTQIVHADSQMLVDFGRVPRIPTLFIYDAAGEVVAEFRRDRREPPSHQELEAAIRQAVGQ